MAADGGADFETLAQAEAATQAAVAAAKRVAFPQMARALEIGPVLTLRRVAAMHYRGSLGPVRFS
jgi:hypothetical protein